MKALTLWQPWASLVAEGVKISETRSWPAPAAVVGERIAIHAAQRQITSADRFGWSAELRAATVMLRRDVCVSGGDLPYGAVIATALLERSVRVDRHDGSGSWWWGYGLFDTSWHEIDGFGDYSVGRFVWFLDDVQLLPEPVPARGQQRLWNLEVTL